MFWLEFAIVLSAIVLGSRLGGIGLGTIAGLGLAVLVLVLRLPPGELPVDVIFIIVAVITAASALEAAGGLDLMVRMAERMLRARPGAITFMAPLVTWLFSFFAGTGHVAYSVLPVIAEVARKAGVRPERPMSIAVIASQQSITAGPISAATAGLVALLAIHDTGYGLVEILMICVPATLIGVLLGALSVVRMGKRLEEDPVYLERMAAGLIAPAGSGVALAPERVAPARRSVVLFLIAAVGVVAFGLFDRARPVTGYSTQVSVWSLWLDRDDQRPKGWIHDTLADTVEQRSLAAALDKKAGLSTVSGLQPHESVVVLHHKDLAYQERFRSAAPEEVLARVRDGTLNTQAPKASRVGMAVTIEIVMLTAAALIMLLCRAQASAVVGGSIMRAGMTAVVAILGLAWMGSTFFEANRAFVQDSLAGVVQGAPWTFAIGLFALSVLLYSQAATVAALMPLGFSLGIDPLYLIAMFPAVNGYFFLPTYGTIVAAIQFDTTGTTRIGKYVLNHSFMRPGLVATLGAVGAGFALVFLYRLTGLIG
jgi:anaerobic C4-dicarboxylate transporter DcuA